MAFFSTLFRPLGPSGESEADKATKKDVVSDIEHAFKRSALPDQDFLPDGEISRLVTTTTVRRLMPGANDDLVEYVCKNAKKVFLTTLFSSHDEIHAAMRSFHTYRMMDHHLPIEDPKAANGVCKTRTEGQCHHKGKWPAFGPWPCCDVSSFYRLQWIFCVPVFSRSDSPLFLEKNCILPFTAMDKGGKGGHFSTVCRAKIHADHYPDYSKSNKTINGEIQVALKELKYLNESRYDVGDAWASEVKALDQINQLQLKHLIRRTGAFKKGEDYYIMFEWADGGNLRDLWQRTDIDCAELNGDRIMKVLEQLLGLAEALSKLHNKANHNKKLTGTPERLARAETLLASPADNVPKIQIQADNESNGDTSKTGEEHWRHGDLKPDNILLFKDAASPWLGTLKIADLGLAKQHEFATSQRVDPTRQVYSTSQYEAPEVVTKPLDPRSRLYDIWSMGCIILEFVIWLLYGHAGLRNFYNEKPKGLASRDTLYFTLKHQGRLAEVSDIVKRWMEHMLQFDPECSGESPSVLGDLIRLVKDHLLVVDLPGEGLVSKNCRGDADFLENSLRSIMLRAKVDAGGSYLFTRSSRKAVQIPKEMSSLSTGPVGKAVASKSPNLVIVPSPGPRR